jgi:uncharacterized cupredoxin-like copper-binding protein
MKTIVFIAACALLTRATAVFPHETQPAAHAAATLEQQDWGIAGDAKTVKRTIKLSMSDTMRFTPDKITVKQGDTVRLAVHNKGKLRHEIVLGTQKALADHAALMLRFPNMEHGEPHMAHVAPGKTGQIIWTFNRSGNFDFACLMPGHYQAGMAGKITVLAAK